MKHTIIDESGATLGTIKISHARACDIAAAKGDAPSDDGVWHFTAGDWLTDAEIEALGTSHENEIQIVSIDRPGFILYDRPRFILYKGGPVGSTNAEGGAQ